MTYAYVGTYTDPDRGGRGKGIHIFELDETDGALKPVDVLTGVPNPHWLSFHPSRPFLYATHGGDASAVSAFAVAESAGGLSLLNTQRSPGPGPTHLGVDPSGRCIAVANYSGGSVAVFPIRPDGGLAPHSDFWEHEGETGPNEKRQEKPHPHIAAFDPTGRFVLVCDLGLDKTLVYRVDVARGRLSGASVGEAPPGSGPRHLVFHPSGRWVYVINELDSTITHYVFSDGRLGQPQQVACLPPDWSGESYAAEVAVTPDGRFAYATNRGHDSLAIFAIGSTTGRLTLVGHQPTEGKHPRHFELAPGGRYLYVANQDTDTIVGFRIEPASGQLTSLGTVAEVGSPTCVTFRAG